MKPKTNPFLRSALLTAVTLACSLSAQAGTYYWDPDGTGILGFGTAGGTWGSSAFWNTDSTGSSGGTTANTGITTADNINFGTASAGLGAGTITGPATAQGFLNMTFGSASGAIVLSGGTLNLATAGSTITVNNTSDTISGTGFSGTGALTKTGTGELVFYGASGDFGGTYVQNISGGLNITAGTVTLSSQKIRFGSVTIGNGATLKSTASWATGASNPWFNGASVGSITVNAGGTLTATAAANGIMEGLTLNGGTVSAPGVSSADWGAFTIGSTVTAGGATTSTISAELAVTGVQTFSVGTGSTLSISGVMHNRFGAAAGGITKADAGTMTLSGANTYTGTTTISGGTLQIGNAGATGSLYSPSVSSGNLTFGSTGAIVNNGALVYNISGGAVHVNKTISGTGTVSVTGNQSVNFAAGTSISTSGSQTYSATATSGRYNGFNLTDNGTVTLTSTAGNISMTGMLGTANGNTGNLTLDTSAGNGNVTLNTPAGISGVDYGLNSLTVTAGTGTISLGTHNSYNWNRIGTISLTGGTINSTANMTDFATLSVTNSGASAFSGALSGGGALTKTGSGTLTLSKTNTYTGGTTVNQGTLALNGTTGPNGTIRGTLTINSGGTVQLNKQDMLGYTGGNFVTQVNINAGIMDNVSNNNNGLTTNFTLTGGTMTASTGSGLYNFNPGYGITTNASANTSTVSAGIILRGSSNNMSFNVADGAAATDLLISGAISQQNAGNGITKSGDGTMVLSNTNTYSGATNVNSGKLVVNGSISTSSLTTVGASGTLGGTGTVGNTTVNGIFAPGNSIGTLNINGSLVLSGIADFEVDPTNGIGLNRSSDLANVSGAITYGGILNLLYGGSASDFTNGMVFNLFDGTSFSGSFSSLNLPTLTGGLTWQDNLATNGTLTVVPEPNAAALLGGMGMLALLCRRR